LICLQTAMKIKFTSQIGRIPRILVSLIVIIINICAFYTYQLIELHSTISEFCVKMLLKVSSPSRAGNSLTSWLMITFHGQTWIHGVSSLCCSVSWYDNRVRRLLFSSMLRFMCLCLFRGNSLFVLVCSQQSQNLWMYEFTAVPPHRRNFFKPGYKKWTRDVKTYAGFWSISR